MPWLGAAILVVGFAVVVRFSGLIGRSKAVVAAAQRSLAVMRDVSLSDEQKEVQLQHNALLLFKLFLFLTIAGTASVLLPSLVVYGFDQLGWLDWDEVLDVALSVRFLAATSVLAVTASVVAQGFSRRV